MEHLHQLFLEAGTLMLTGMIFVFSFLGLLVIFIKTVLAKLAIKFPDAVVQPKSQTRTQGLSNKSNSSVKGISPNIVAAITSAVTQYRQQHSKTNRNNK
ncbi:MAG: OadG family protein [Alteromonadaceae bacterium]|nr:OadG family protein [Alteromonadaceae bacterium]